MTDQPNENEEMPEGLVFVHLPQHVQQMMAHQKMTIEAAAHEAAHFFESLNEEQLRAFRGILRVIRNNETACDYYAGLTSGELKNRFGVCLGCGKKHDEDLEKFLTDAAPVPDQPIIGEGPTEPPPVKKEVPLGGRPGSNEWSVNMEKYGLIFNEVGKISCAHCGRDYVSLADRMLRPPGIEGCDGCQHKEAFG